MATGKPLILSDIPGVRDVISNDEGFIVEPLDPEVIKTSIEKIGILQKWQSRWVKKEKELKNYFVGKGFKGC